MKRSEFLFVGGILAITCAGISAIPQCCTPEPQAPKTVLTRKYRPHLTGGKTANDPGPTFSEKTKKWEVPEAPNGDPPGNEKYREAIGLGKARL